MTYEERILAIRADKQFMSWLNSYPHEWEGTGALINIYDAYLEGISVVKKA